MIKTPSSLRSDQIEPPSAREAAMSQTLEREVLGRRWRTLFDDICSLLRFRSQNDMAILTYQEAAGQPHSAWLRTQLR